MKLTQTSLERLTRRPGSDETVSIDPKCHPESGMRAAYNWNTGCVTLICCTCDAGVARLLLAVTEPS